MGNETVVNIPRLSLDETPTLPPFPLVKVSEFVDSSLGFALSRATLGVGALFFGSVFVACSLPDVALPPPRMVLFGALAQVLLVPPSGYRCFRRRPGCLASVRGVFVAHCLPSSLCLMATKAFGPVWGSFPLHHASCVVGVLCAPSLRYSSSYDPWPLSGLR